MVIQQLVAADFDVLEGEGERTSFYSAILEG